MDFNLPIEVDEIYPHEIKAKRIKKELHAIISEQYKDTTLGAVKQCAIGLRIPVLIYVMA